jgi:hypothetical protein
MEKEIFKKILLTEENIDYLKDEKIESWNIKKLLGIKLSQSQSIKFGFVFQYLVKKLIISAGGVIIDKKFIDIYNTGNSGKKNKGLKDVDILFSMNNIIYYFEMKTNLNLDSEKSKSTDIKVADITNWVIANYPDNIVKAGVLSCWFKKEPNLEVKVKNVFYMEDLFGSLNIDITREEYYSVMAEYGKSILERTSNN